MRKKVNEIRSQIKLKKPKVNSKGISSKDELLTTTELCSILKISRVTLWKLEIKGTIPYIRIGNQKRFQLPIVLQNLSDVNYPKL